MRTPRGAWVLGGVLAGLAGTAVSHAVAMALHLRESPMQAVASLVVRATPGPVSDLAIGNLGSAAKPVLLTAIGLGLLVLFALAGLLARRRWWAGLVLPLALAAIGATAMLLRPEIRGPLDLLPVLAALVTWVGCLALVLLPLRRSEAAASAPSRRAFLLGAGAVALLAAVGGVAGQLLRGARDRVEETRRLLRLPLEAVPPVLEYEVDQTLSDLAPWRTPNDDFYVVHTALAVPTVDPSAWRLRIHGMVERELELTLEDLVRRPVTEAWMTLGCVSNEVGGDLVGNAWWSGVRVAEVLAEAGVDPRADAVLQTSEDGWTCATPLAALTDERSAMLAFGMNGEPLPVEHGFPVRTVVPGLYGYVSACKWVVDLQVTRFDRVEAYWTSRGWAERAPVRQASRIDVPRQGQAVRPGPLRAAGVAWHQHTGVEQVEVQLDGGGWQSTVLGGVPSVDTWRQWVVDLDVAPGDHVLRVRSVNGEGEVQSGILRDPVPDGATGWHEIEFTVEEET